MPTEDAGGTYDDGGVVGDAATFADTAPADSGTTSSPDTGTGSTTAACTSDTWSDWPRTFFSSHCTRCHGNQLTSLSVVHANEGVIASDIRSGRMPQDEVLSSADKSRIITWLNCGAP